MVQYMMIENEGNVCIDDLRLIGSSSKRGDDTKIGQFGSGWKYALAWLIRNEATPIIFSSLDEIKIGYNYSIHRGNPVRVITINEVESSLTAEMGPQWKGWMAFREIFSNAIDEGGHVFKFGLSESDMEKKDGVTRVYIPIVPQLFDVVKEFDTYFSLKLTPTYENSIAKMFVFDEPKYMVSYRKGIRCYEDEGFKLKFALDINDINVSEDRVAASYDVRRTYVNFITNCEDVATIKLYMQSSLGSSYKSITGSLNSHAVEAFNELVTEGCTFTTQILARLKPCMGAIMLSDDLYSKLVELDIIAHALSNMVKGLNFLFSRDESFYATENEVKYHLSEANTNIQVSIGDLDDDCKYDTTNGITTYYLSSKLVANNTSKQMAALCLISSEDIHGVASLFK